MVYQQLLVMQKHVESLGSDTWALIEQQQQLLVMQQQQDPTQELQLQQQDPQQPSSLKHALAKQLPSKGSDIGNSSIRGYSDNSTAKPTAATSEGTNGSAAGAAQLEESRAASSDVCIHMQDTGVANTCQAAGGEQSINSNRQQEPQQLSAVEQQFVGDACDDDVREFIAARALLQDALKAADAERHVAWLFGRPIIIPSILLPCSTSAGCCFCPRTKASRDSITVSHSNSLTASCSTSGTGKDAAQPRSSTSNSSQQDDVCGLPAFLPSQQVRLVAIAQRHCSLVLWMLHKLLQGGFDEQALLAVHRKYPAGMLVSIQRNSQAVLQAATSLLQSAIQQHHHWHLRKDKGRTALLLQQLQQLRANMDSLHGHLQQWQEIFLNISHLRREVVLQMLQDSGQLSPPDTATTAPAPATLPATVQSSQPAGSTAQAPQAPVCGSAAAAAAAAAVTAPAAALSGLPALVQLSGQEATEHGKALMQQVPELFFITPTARESYLFVLQWHALHYILQQLDLTFTQLTSSLQELLSAMHQLTDL